MPLHHVAEAAAPQHGTPPDPHKVSAHPVVRFMCCGLSTLPWATIRRFFSSNGLVPFSPMCVRVVPSAETLTTQGTEKPTTARKASCVAAYPNFLPKRVLGIRSLPSTLERPAEFHVAPATLLDVRPQSLEASPWLRSRQLLRVPWSVLHTSAHVRFSVRHARPDTRLATSFPSLTRRTTRGVNDHTCRCPIVGRMHNQPRLEAQRAHLSCFPDHPSCWKTSHVLRMSGT